MTSFSVIVTAPLEKVWESLMYKIEHPEAFVPGVGNVIIIEKTDGFVLRQMTVAVEGNSVKIIEKITSAPYLIRFEIIDHPQFEGYVDNEAVAISKNETQITFTMNWVDKQTKIQFGNSDLIKNAVLKTKLYIEQNP